MSETFTELEQEVMIDDFLDIIKSQDYNNELMQQTVRALDTKRLTTMKDTALSTNCCYLKMLLRMYENLRTDAADVQIETISSPISMNWMQQQKSSDILTEIYRIIVSVLH